MNHQIAIIMPCFNAGEYVATAIESVLSQGMPVQLLVVDDGSTDNTMEILARYSSDIHILQYDHQGVSNARNMAVEHINSRYTLLLDADDALATDSLASLLQKINRNGKEVVYGHFSSWDSAMTRKLCMHRPVSLGKAPMSILTRYNLSPPGAILFPTDAFARAGIFDQSLVCCEDWDFVIRMARAGYQFTRLNREIFYYRRRASSASNQVGRMLGSGLEVVRRCHFPDDRVNGDLYKDGYASEKLDANLFNYHATCMGLSSLSTDIDEFARILDSLNIPAEANWREFGKLYRLSLWWNSLTIEGNQTEVIVKAKNRAAGLIREIAGAQPWCRDMILGILTPDFMELLRQPGPKKALRLFREWKRGRQIIDKLGLE